MNNKIILKLFPPSTKIILSNDEFPFINNRFFPIINYNYINIQKKKILLHNHNKRNTLNLLKSIQKVNINIREERIYNFSAD